MFGFSFGEVLLIGVIALIALGPKQLPEVARSLGRALNELKRASGDFQRNFFDATEISQKTIQNLQQSIQERLDAKVNAPSATLPAANDGESKAQLSFELESQNTSSIQNPPAELNKKES